MQKIQLSSFQILKVAYFFKIADFVCFFFISPSCLLLFDCFYFFYSGFSSSFFPFFSLLFFSCSIIFSSTWLSRNGPSALKEAKTKVFSSDSQRKKPFLLFEESITFPRSTFFASLLSKVWKVTHYASLNQSRDESTIDFVNLFEVSLKIFKL